MEFSILLILWKSFEIQGWDLYNKSGVILLDYR